MKPKKTLVWIIACTLGSIAQSHAQRDVFSRSDAGTGLWWHNTNNPWFYLGSGTNPQNRPDNDSLSTTRHNVFIGHNNNTTMTVNGAFFGLRTLTLQNTASTNRTFNASDGGGISLSVGLTNDSAGSHTFNVPIGVDGSTVTFASNNGSLSFTNNFFLNANTAAFSGTNTTSVSGLMSGSGGSVSKSGAGTLSLTNNSNSYTGATTLSAGTLRAGGNNVFGASTINLNGGTLASTSGTARTIANQLNIGGNVIFGQSSEGTGALGFSNTGSVNLGAATRSLTTVQSTTIAGNLSNGGIIKEGVATLTLTGSNNQLSSTTVANGTLMVNGSLTGSVSVSSGATLGGTGVIAGAVNVTGVLSPGASIESLGTGTLTFASGSSYAYEFNSSTVAADLSYITGSLNIGSNVALNLSDEVTSTVLPMETKFTLFSYTGEWNNVAFTGYENNSTFTLGENMWRILYEDSSGGLNFQSNQSGATGFVTLTVIPELSAAMLGSIGMLVLLRRRRR